MFHEADTKKIQEYCELDLEELSRQFSIDPSRERLAALLRHISSAFVAHDYERIGELQAALNKISRDECSESTELVNEALLEALDFTSSQLLRRRPKSSVAVNLSRGEKQILQYLFRNPNSFTRQISRALERPESSVSRSLSKSLRDKALVDFQKSGRRHEYFLTDLGYRVVISEGLDTDGQDVEYFDPQEFSRRESKRRKAARSYDATTEFLESLEQPAPVIALPRDDSSKSFDFHQSTMPEPLVFTGSLLDDVESTPPTRAAASRSGPGKKVLVEYLEDGTPDLKVNQ